MRLKIAAVLLLLAACSEEHGPSRDGDDGAPEDETRGAGSMGECEVTTSSRITPGDKPKTNWWSYDAGTRRLVATMYAYDIDENGRIWKVYGNDRGILTRYWTNHYDEHGNLDSYDHYTSGTLDYRNTYDAEGRLKTAENDGYGGGPALLTTYHYEDPTAPGIWTRCEGDLSIDGTIDALIERTITDARTDTVRTTARGAPQSTYSFKYKDDRIDTIDRDGGFGPGDVPDGDVEIRYQWKRDPDGNVIEFTQDGTTAFDNPVVDGTPDSVEKFSEGCALLFKKFPWLSHEPGQNSTGPRFRDDSQ